MAPIEGHAGLEQLHDRLVARMLARLRLHQQCRIRLEAFLAQRLPVAAEARLELGPVV
jgi:hypothetical protein